MHPRFVTLSAQARIPNVKFIVGGIGGEFATLQKQAEELGAADQFDPRGYVRDITPFFEILDVFGYPLCSTITRPPNWYCKKPCSREFLRWFFPTVLPPSLSGIMKPGWSFKMKQITGGRSNFCIVSPKRESDWAGMRELDAEAHFGADKSAMEMNDVYERLIKSPKRTRRFGPQVRSGAEALYSLSVAWPRNSERACWWERKRYSWLPTEKSRRRHLCWREGIRAAFWIIAIIIGMMPTCACGRGWCSRRRGNYACRCRV